jgi:uncharacterized protein YbjT (DUF2867 family)
MSILLAGSTGEIGHRLTQNLIVRNQNSPIYALVRRISTKQPSSDFIPIQVDFNELKGTLIDLTDPKDSVAICCLGTTIKNAGTIEAFRKVDLEYVVNFARLAKQLGIEKFMVVSSIGATTNSNNQYIQAKGEMEAQVSELGFQSTYFIQPSLLIGNRKEFRLAEKLGGLLSGLISPLLIGSLRKYRPIQMDTVAKAMASLTTNMKDGIHRVRYDELMRLS